MLKELSMAWQAQVAQAKASADAQLAMVEEEADARREAQAAASAASEATLLAKMNDMKSGGGLKKSGRETLVQIREILPIFKLKI